MGFDVLSIVQMIGGLALFIYGMTTMGKGLERAAGSKLEKTLEKMTGNVVNCSADGHGSYHGHSIFVRNDRYGCRLCKRRYS